MATARSVIKRAMRILTILQSGEEPSAGEAQDGLEVLNSMLHKWELDGIRLNHTDLALNDTLPWLENHIEPIVYNFAVRYADEFGKSITMTTVAGAESGYRDLQNYYADPADAQTDDALNPFYNPGRFFDF